MHGLSRKRTARASQRRHRASVDGLPLARAPYAGVELNEEIPPEHFKAVAEVIGFVMRQRGVLPAEGDLPAEGEMPLR